MEIKKYKTMINSMENPNQTKMKLKKLILRLEEK